MTLDRETMRRWSREASTWTGDDYLWRNRFLELRDQAVLFEAEWDIERKRADENQQGWDVCAELLEAAGRDYQEALRERDEAMKGLWDAYVATGSDPDGDKKWHAPPADAARYTVLAVEELRRDYEAECDDD